MDNNAGRRIISWGCADNAHGEHRTSSGYHDSGSDLRVCTGCSWLPILSFKSGCSFASWVHSYLRLPLFSCFRLRSCRHKYCLRANLFKSGWVILHVGSLFLANALFALAFSVGIMYLLQERHIKKKNFGFLYERLPSLERLDSIAHYCLMSGFPLMTAGLITGFAYAAIVWHSPWNWDPKEILSLVTWIIYAVLVHERLAVGWRGRRAAWLSILGFSAILLTFVGASLLLSGHHSVLSGKM